MFRAVLAGVFVFVTSLIALADPVDFGCKNCEISEAVAKYSKLANRTVIIDPNVRGKLTILSAGKMEVEDAFNLLSQSLASNGYTFIGEGPVLQLTTARTASRSNIPVYNSLPPLKPERLVTWVRTLNKLKTDQLAQIRLLASRDGEIQFLNGPERFIMTDFTGNIHRVSKVVDELDK